MRLLGPGRAPIRQSRGRTSPKGLIMPTEGEIAVCTRLVPELDVCIDHLDSSVRMVSTRTRQCSLEDLENSLR